MLIRKRLTGALTGVAVLIAGGLVTTANAMGPPTPDQTRPIDERPDTSIDNTVETGDIIRTLP